MKSIYIENDVGELSQMTLTKPKEERILQELIARHSVLVSLADEELLLIEREAGAAGTEAQGERWSLDHLFVTRDSVPVLIEVKRADDTRIRREVVGQMLDYAANGSMYWTADTMETGFANTCELADLDPDEVLSDFMSPEQLAEDFWSQAEANLRAGRIKLRFVADRIPEELSRVVRFLNAHADFEVLAIELASFSGDDGLTTIVPSIIGESEKIVRKTGQRRPPNPLLRDILSTYASVETTLSTRSEGRGSFAQLSFGSKKREHYEWLIKKRENELHVAVHFESSDLEENLAGAESIRASVETLAETFNARAEVGAWGTKWASAALVFDLSDSESESFAENAVLAMVSLIDSTLPTLRQNNAKSG